MRDVTLRFGVAVFDFDGTISLLRHGWQNVMADFMLGVLSQDQEDSTRLTDEIHKLIADSAGANTIDQMESLRRLADREGVGDLRTADSYKTEYQETLKQMVSTRIQRGARTPSDLAADFLVPGVADFLDLLGRKGLPMYIASGTDQEDVVSEASLLGVLGYFKAAYGPGQQNPGFTKKWAAEEVLRIECAQPDSLVVLGDGPSEITAAKEVGGAAIGVASEGSLGRVNSEKAAILRAAGADLIVPDFNERDALGRFLGGCGT